MLLRSPADPRLRFLRFPAASVTLPVTTNRLDEASLLADPALSQALQTAIAALARAAEAHRDVRSSV
jgi:hypothetical protein